MKLRAKKLTEQDAKEASSWKYSGDYEIYNLPSWDEMVKQNYSLCDELKRSRFTAYLSEDNELMGFVNLLDEGDSVFFGIGVNPIHCSKGIGKQIIKLALEDCRRRFLGKPVVLEVRTWNNRAIACYKSQGFEIIDTKIQETNLGVGEFYVMKYVAQ